MADDPVIVVGGSLRIEFNPTAYTPDLARPGNFTNAARRITSVDIRDDNTGNTESCQIPENGKCTITIHTEG
jgi:hypothetical protein